MNPEMNSDSRKRKKGICNLSEYSKNKAKGSRVSGQEYCNSRKVVIPKKQPRDELRNVAILSLLMGLMRMSPVSRRRPRADATKQKPRSATFIYSLPDTAGAMHKVCKTMFLNTFDLKFERVRRLHHLIIKVRIPQRKNLGNKHHSNPEQLKNLIKDHIKSYPTHESHYSGKAYIYLDPRLSIKKLHKDFKLKYPGLNAKYTYYYTIFKQHFNLHFGRPQVDTCITCESLKVTISNSHVSEAAKSQADTELTVHLARAKKFYKKIKVTKTQCQNRDMVGLTFDYMQNLLLPNIPVQDVFYLRQLWVNTFLIHNLKTGASVAYMYHEGIVKKGANDVCSMLSHYIKNYVPSTIKNLRLISDGCTGQNKNHAMIRFCAALVDSGRFKNVRQFFPERGHSYNPCDLVFGTIKRTLKQNDRVYVPMEYVSLTAQSVTTPGNLEIVYLQDNDIFFDFTGWWPAYYSKTAISEETKGRSVNRSQKIHFQPSAFKEYRHSSKKPGLVQALEFIDCVVKSNFKLIFSSRVRLPYKKAYNGVNPINAKKLQDIRKLIPYIPDKHKQFYNQILEWPTTNIDCGEEDD